MTYSQKVFWIFAAFLSLRLYFLLTFPPFVDESNYIWQGQYTVSKAEYAFDSIKHLGKQPLPFWIVGAFSKLFDDFIFGGRVANFIFSIPAFFLLFDLARKLSGKTAALFAILIYTFAPIFIVSNSMAMFDGYLLYLSIAILWLLMTLSKKVTLKYLVILGMTLGLILWIKANGVIQVITALVLLFLILRASKKTDKIKSVVFVMVVSLLFLLPLLLIPDFDLIVEQTQKYTFLNTLSAAPAFSPVRNFFYIVFTLAIYLSPFVLLAPLSILKNTFKHPFFKILVVWFLVPCILVIISASDIRTRYMLSGLAGALPLFAIGSAELLKHSRVKKTAALLLFIPLITLGILCAVYPPGFFGLFPKDTFLFGERNYVYEWPSGYGIREALDYFEKIRPVGKNVILAIPDLFISYPTTYVSLYYQNHPLVKVISVTYTSAEGFRELRKASPDEIIYFISSSYFINKDIEPFLKELRTFPKPGNEDHLILSLVK